MLLFLLSNSALHNWDIPKANFFLLAHNGILSPDYACSGLVERHFRFAICRCGEYAVKIRPISPIVFILPHC